MKILLGNGYFVEIDNLNHTLKQEYIGTNKEGAFQQYEKVHGYFSNLDSAVERYLLLNQNDLMADSRLGMKKYLELVRLANENAVKAFKEVNAYDVEKVVEQIHGYFKSVIDKSDSENVPIEVLDYNKAICDIVRGGRE